MKNSLSILTAAAAAVATLIRQVTEAHLFDPDDDVLVIPEMTAALVKQYTQAGATDQEIADRFLVEVHLIQQRFGHVIKCNRALRNIHMRSMQFELAKKLNGPMLIWLGRNELGQSISPGKPGEAMPEMGEE